MAKRSRKPVVVISGGARGLGLAIAREFADLGARIAICSRTSSQLERAREELTRRGAEVFAVTCDLTDEVQTQDFVRRVGAVFGSVDVLVNNAGTIQVGPVETMRVGDLRDAMNSIFWSAVYLTLGFLPDIKPGARIINITSLGAEVAMPHLLPYSAAKFAMRGFSEGLSAELRKKGIRVLTVMPGLMRTGSARNAVFKGDRKREFDLFSLSAKAPGITIDATRAARKIVHASFRGRTVLSLGWTSKLARVVHGIFPGTAIALLSWVNRMLPEAPARTREEEAVPGHRLGAWRDRDVEKFNEAA